MKTFQLQLITPEKVAVEKEVEEAILPTPLGQITILPDHMPLISTLSAGEIVLKKGNETLYLALSSGFLEVAENKVRVLADTAEIAEEIDEIRAEEAKKRAEHLLETSKEKVEIAQASAALERALTRLKVTKRKKHYSSTRPRI